MKKAKPINIIYWPHIWLHKEVVYLLAFVLRLLLFIFSTNITTEQCFWIQRFRTDRRMTYTVKRSVRVYLVPIFPDCDWKKFSNIWSIIVQPFSNLQYSINHYLDFLRFLTWFPYLLLFIPCARCWSGTNSRPCCLNLVLLFCVDNAYSLFIGIVLCVYFARAPRIVLHQSGMSFSGKIRTSRSWLQTGDRGNE